MTSDAMHPRILVTGSGGQLGSELCRLLGSDAIGLDLPVFDVTDAESVRSAVQRFRPSVVINAAAFTQVDRAEIEPERCRDVNVRGVENLVAACRACDVSIVQVSTDYVFDGRQVSPYREADPPNPINTYGRTKWEAEQAVGCDPRHLIVRTAGLFGLAGPRAGGNFVDTVLRHARLGKPLRVVNDQVTCFTYTSHLARAIKSLLEAREAGVFHLANSGAGSWYELACKVFEVAGLTPRIEAIRAADYACTAERPKFSVLDTQKYARVEGCFTMPSWQHAVSAYLASVQA